MSASVTTTDGGGTGGAPGVERVEKLVTLPMPADPPDVMIGIACT
jgi:hypothetical protein